MRVGESFSLLHTDEGACASVVVNWIDWLSRMPGWNCIIERRAHGIESAAGRKI